MLISQNDYLDFNIWVNSYNIDILNIFITSFFVSKAVLNFIYKRFLFLNKLSKTAIFKLMTFAVKYDEKYCS